MNILQISPQVPYPPNDGGKISIYGITKSLNSRGHNVYFLAYSKDIDIDMAKNQMSRISSPLIVEQKINNNIFSLIKNLFSPIPYNIAKFKKRKLVKVLINFLSEKDIDLVHVDHLHMAWVIEVIKMIKPNLPVVLREHNLELKIMQRYYIEQKNFLLKFFAKLQYNKFKTYEPKMCEKFDKCIMISQKDEEELHKLNDNIISITITVGVDRKLLKKKKTNLIPYSMFHIGSMDWFPNYDGLNWYLNDIFPKLIKEIPQTKLFLYGKNLSKIDFSQKIKNNIEIKGFVEDIWTEVLDKQLAIVPLRVGSGIRIKIIELLAIGQNIISTSIGKEGIEVTDEKEILIADSVDDFVSKTLKYFNNNYNSKEMSSNSKKIIEEKFTWDIIGEKIEKEYEYIINLMKK